MEKNDGYIQRIIIDFLGKNRCFKTIHKNHLNACFSGADKYIVSKIEESTCDCCIDCFDGQPVSWTIGIHPDVELVNKMLVEAIATLKENEKPLVHSDRGGHYRWPGWIKRMDNAGLTKKDALLIIRPVKDSLDDLRMKCFTIGLGTMCPLGAYTHSIEENGFLTSDRRCILLWNIQVQQKIPFV